MDSRLRGNDVFPPRAYFAASCIFSPACSTFFNIVDMALYLAKGHGRNRAYGVRGLAGLDPAAMDEIEQDIEKAWRNGLVDLSVVTAHVADLRMAS